MEKKNKFPWQEEINKEAKLYCDAKNSGNIGQMKARRNSIITLISSSSICKMIYAKLNDYQKSALEIENDKDLTGYIFDFVVKSIDEYGFNINQNFCAWFVQRFTWKLKNIIRNTTTTKYAPLDENKNKIPQPKSVPLSTYDSKSENSDEIRNKYEPIYEDITFEEKDNLSEMRVKLISVYTLFNNRKKGKAANHTKHEYYRIFITESLIRDIQDNNSLKGYNKQEIMQVADGDFVRFVAFTTFNKAEDFITLTIKKYSDIFEDGEKKELKLNHEAKVIIEYRFVYGFDKKRVSNPTVSQQLSSFKEDIKELFK